MRVLIPVDSLHEQEITGLQRYIRELLNGIARRGDVELTALCYTRRDMDGIDERVKRLERGPLPARFDRLARFFLPPRRLADYDIVHCPSPYGHYLTKPRGARFIMTNHDMIPAALPDTVPFVVRNWFRHILPRMVPHYDHFISVSQFTADEMVRVLKIDPSRITVVHEASHIPTSASPAEERDRLLAVSTIAPHKNFTRIVESFMLLIERRPDLRTRLSILGRWGWKVETSRRAFERCGDRIEILGHVSDEQLIHHYRTAKCLVYASLFEGFGLPILEAMSCGCPVITSNRTSLPEVGGDAAIYVDPESIDSIADAMERILDDGALRRSMREKGLVQAAKFSWDRCAAETVAVYRKVLAHRD